MIYQMEPIAHIESDFPTKFGIPRQSGIADQLRSRIVFEDKYRVSDAVRGMEGFSHLWLVWVFSESIREEWSPTVRPPKLGGNTRVGVFATRSPFRPNPIGLSCVRLEQILQEDGGPVLVVSGADLMDGTPILDIKPYLPYADCKPDALGGFAPLPQEKHLTVCDPQDMLSRYPAEKAEAARQILSADPRPGYQHSPERVYGIPFAGFDIRFTVADTTLTVIACEPLQK